LVNQEEKQPDQDLLKLEYEKAISHGEFIVGIRFNYFISFTTFFFILVGAFYYVWATEENVPGFRSARRRLRKVDGNKGRNSTNSIDAKAEASISAHYDWSCSRNSDVLRISRFCLDLSAMLQCLQDLDLTWILKGGVLWTRKILTTRSPNLMRYPRCWSGS